MAIVPSGKRKLMKLQQNYQVTDQEGDATQSEVTGDDSGNSGNPAFDINQIKQDMSSQSVAGPQYGAEDFQAAAQGGKISGPNNIEDSKEVVEEMGQKGANIRGYVFKALEELGAPTRLIIENPDAFFQGKKDLDTGTLTGSYILPSYTKDKKITQDEAESIAMQIGSKFGLSQSISPQGNNFKVDFHTKEVVNEEDHGTSLQELIKSRGGKGGSGQMARAAKTHSEMIKESRSEFFDKLQKLGLGEK